MEHIAEHICWAVGGKDEREAYRTMVYLIAPDAGVDAVVQGINTVVTIRDSVVVHVVFGYFIGCIEAEGYAGHNAFDIVVAHHVVMNGVAAAR